jgi:hypothetical protein
MDLQQGEGARCSESRMAGVKSAETFKRRKYFVHPSVQGAYIAFSIVPAILASVFCTYALIRGGEVVLRAAREKPLVPIYAIRQTILTLEKDGYNQEASTKVANLKKELAVLKAAMEETYYETLIRWEGIRRQTFLVLFFCVVLVGLLALLHSHRIAGPLFRIGKCINMLSEGKDPGPIRLRKRDQYQDIAKSLEKLRRTLGRQGSLRQQQASPGAPSMTDTE